MSVLLFVNPQPSFSFNHFSPCPRVLSLIDMQCHIFAQFFPSSIVKPGTIALEACPNVVLARQGNQNFRLSSYQKWGIIEPVKKTDLINQRSPGNRLFEVRPHANRHYESTSPHRKTESTALFQKNNHSVFGLVLAFNGGFSSRYRYTSPLLR